MLKTIAEKGVPLDIDSYSMLIINACSANDVSRALSFLSSMSSKGLHPSPSASFSLLSLFVASDNHPAVLQHLKTMRDHYARLSEAELSDIMTKAVTKWTPSQCVEVMREAQMGGMEPYKAYRVVMDHSVAFKDWASSEKLVALMLSPAVTIKSPIFFINLARGKAREGLIQQVIDLAGKMHSRQLTFESKHYANIMLSVNPPFDHFSLSLLYNDMIKYHVQPTREVYECMIESASKLKKNTEVVDYYNKLRQQGDTLTNVDLIIEVARALAYLNEGERFWELINNESKLHKHSKTLITAHTFFKKNNNSVMCSRIFSILFRSPLPNMAPILDNGLPVLIGLANNKEKDAKGIWKKEADECLATHKNLLSQLSPETTAIVEAYLKGRGRSVQSVKVSSKI